MKKLVRIHGLVLELKLPREWLLSEARKGNLPCLKVGRHFLFNTNAVRDALAERAAKERITQTATVHGGHPATEPSDSLSPSGLATTGRTTP